MTQPSTEITETVKQFLQDTQESVGLIAETEIKSHQDLQTCTSWVNSIKEQQKIVDEQRKSFTAPLSNVVKEINSFFKPVLDSLSSAEVGLKDKIGTYIKVTTSQRDQALAAVGSAETSKEKIQLIEEADKLQIPEIEGLSIRESISGEMIDEGAFLRWAICQGDTKFISPNIEAIKKLTKELGDDPDIPGWKVSLNKSIVISKPKSTKSTSNYIP